MPEPRCIQIAAAMLDANPETMQCTHTELYDRLIRVTSLTQPLGGELVSRQVIALIVDGWMVRR